MAHTMCTSYAVKSTHKNAASTRSKWVDAAFGIIITDHLIGESFAVIFLELALGFVPTFGNSLVEIASRPGSRCGMLRNTDNKFCSLPSLFLVYYDFAIDDFITVLL